MTISTKHRLGMREPKRKRCCFVVDSLPEIFFIWIYSINRRDNAPFDIYLFFAGSAISHEL